MRQRPIPESAVRNSTIGRHKSTIDYPKSTIHVRNSTIHIDKSADTKNEGPYSTVVFRYPPTCLTDLRHYLPPYGHTGRDDKYPTTSII